jgi:hypothetical protein
MRNPFQARANALPGDVYRSGYAREGRHLNAWPYQERADEQFLRSANSNQVEQGFPPVVENMTQGWGRNAARQAGRAMRADTLTIPMSGLGGAVGKYIRGRRRSGSVTRTATYVQPPDIQIRLSGAFEDAKASGVPVDCTGLDKDAKMALVGFVLARSGKGRTANQIFDDAAELLGTAEALCLHKTMSSRWWAGSGASDSVCAQMPTGAGDPIMQRLICMGAMDEWGLTKEEFQRAAAAGQRMEDKGWWGAGWETKWWLLSGSTPWYKNPLYWAGGVAGFVAYRYATKRK